VFYQRKIKKELSRNLELGEKIPRVYSKRNHLVLIKRGEKKRYQAKDRVERESLCGTTKGDRGGR